MPGTKIDVGEFPSPGEPSLPPRMGDRKPGDAPAPREDVLAELEDATERGLVFGFAFGADRLDDLENLFEKVQRPLSELAEMVPLPSDYPLEVRELQIKAHPMAAAAQRSRIVRRPYTLDDLRVAYEAALAEVRNRVQAKGGGYLTLFCEACARAIQDAFFDKVGLPTGHAIDPALRGLAGSHSLAEFSARIAMAASAKSLYSGLEPNLIGRGVLGHAARMYDLNIKTFSNERLPDWKLPIGLNPDERAVTFETVEDCDRALRMIYDESEALHRAPCEVGDNRTLIFPAEAVPLLAEKGLKFHDSKVRPAGG